MTFEVIPAVDVRLGRLARFTAARDERVMEHEGDPLDAARSFVRAGARWLHVVDLDLALTGRAGNLELLRSIAELGVKVQAAGALVDRHEVEAALAAGATRAVLGSAALVDPNRAGELVEAFGDRLVVGIEVSGDRIRARGRRATDLPFEKTLEAVVAAGARRILVTAVERVGTLGGPDLRALTAALHSGCPVIAAGGISSVEDLAAVRATGAEGAVVGRAALEGGLDLAEAIASGADSGSASGRGGSRTDR